MARDKRKTANTVADSTLPKTPIEIDGETYFLCFDLGALAEAEMHFIRQGHDVNLLRVLPGQNLTSIRIMFPCAAHKFQPDLGFEEGQAMVTILNVYEIAQTIADAWEAAVPVAVPKTEANKETENPSQP